MALMTMEREPEVARFIDTYKFDQDMATRRDRYGGGTSLPLNSDGYEDKQKILRDERHKDWLQQQDKPRSRDAVYYRVGTPEEGFAGLGNYEKQRQEINLIRQKEYNDMLKKQRQMEQQKTDSRRHKSPPRPAQPMAPQMDYNAASENARAEERRAYQDYMGKYQYPTNGPVKPPIDYEENKKVLNEERKREYNQLMEKKAKEERYWAMRGRPVTPPGGLNIGNYDRQVKETAAAKKKEYKEMLDQQKNEQLALRAMDRVAEVSPKYVKYRDQERPLVGSPRDINYNLREKEEKDKFRKDLKGRPKHNHTPPTENLATEQTSADVDSNTKAFIEVEREKVLNKRKYAEDLLKQQREHMYLRARQEPEISVLDRNGPSSNFLANKPPPGPGFSRARDEPKYQTPSYWNEGRQSRGPRSFDSDVSGSNQSSGIPVELKTKNKSRPMPERPRHGQPPYYGEGQGQNDLKFDKLDPMSRSPVNLPAKSPLQQRSLEKPHPRSPEKLDPVWLRQPLRDDERIDGIGTPLAFKNESQSRPIPERQLYGQPPYPGEVPHQNDLEGRRPYQEPLERSRSPGMQPPRSPEKPLDPEWLRVPLRDDERPAELGTPLADERRRQEDIRHQQLQMSKPTEIVKNPFYSSDDYEKFQREIQRKQGEEYREFLSKKSSEVRNRDWNFEQNGVLELRGDDAVQSKQRELKAERQREYNNYMSQMKPSANRIWPEPEGRGALLVKKGAYDSVRQLYDEERKRDLVNTLQKRREQRVSNPSRRHEFVDTASGPYGGLFHGLGEHGNRTEVLNRERHQEYNEKLDQQFGKDRPSGRPNWVKESLPNDVDRGRSPMRNPPDQYQQILDEKRREEASRRRYEDPEYQGRLAQGRDRGEAGQRYGY